MTVSVQDDAQSQPEPQPEPQARVKAATRAKSAKSKLPSKRQKKQMKDPRHAAFGNSLAKLFKQLHPKLTCSKQAVLLANGVVERALQRLIDGTNDMVRLEDKSTIKAKHVEAAAHMLFHSGLSDASISSGKQAVAAFTAA